MKREIKFRGKRLDNGEWVYGSLTTQKFSPRFRGDYCIFDGSWYVIDPATVGQYTGLKDYNNVEIYEGDIVGISQDGMRERAVVKFKRGSFVLVSNKKIIDSIWGYDPDIFEVIGNIHDNPELLNP